ncbi:glycerol dehydratase reactivase beta/small subunit family protein [Lentilactobacillus sp. Marseille-Q4993]|uniref:glycerol dehydratase reactivase beta/small subunit family protein n=1 Tax=Lentilactobacillus sp. Marseille-Q4993 TaxID=3039492 RepID=UPI0024BCA0DD|nr:glycerol dehydratase reactivase beta/small subunit family protein [Lentilactobacillus sp. Marseille-Q4993]
MVVSNSDRPSILIAMPTGVTEVPDAIKTLTLGIEEEQIPFDFINVDKSTPVERAYDAAVGSRLSVGISFDDHNVVVHYKNLKPDDPLFNVPLGDVEQNRIVGANAARLVKGVPFKL